MPSEPTVTEHPRPNHTLTYVGIAIAILSVVATLATSEVRSILCRHLGLFCPVSITGVRCFAFDSDLERAMYFGPFDFDNPPRDLRTYDRANRFAQEPVRPIGAELPPVRTIYWELDVTYPKSEGIITIDIDAPYLTTDLLGAITTHEHHVHAKSEPRTTHMQIVGIAAEFPSLLPAGRHSVELSIDAGHSLPTQSLTFELYH